VQRVFNDPNSVRRLRITQARSLLDVDLQLADWIRNVSPGPVVHYVFLQSCGHSKWYVRWTRKSDRSSCHGHSILSASGKSDWQSARNVSTAGVDIGPAKSARLPPTLQELQELPTFGPHDSQT